MKASKPSQNYSKSNISIQNNTKKSKSKKKVRLNKVKSSKLLIKKDKIKNTSSGKTKRSSKSPQQISDVKYQTIEIIKNFDKRLQSSPNLILETDTQDTPLMKTKEMLLKSNNDDDFLAFVEKQEIMHQKNKELSCASTYAGTTNIKLGRPFSGDQANKNQNPKGSYIVTQNKMIPNSKLVRPKTAKFDEKFNHKIELNYEKQTSVADPTHYEEDKHLSNIDETSSKKTDTEYELSSENSDDKLEKSIVKQYEGSPLMSHEKGNSGRNSRFPELENEPVNESSQAKLEKSISAHNILFESSNTNHLYQHNQSEQEKNQNEDTMRNNESGIEFDNFVESLLIPKSSQINLGSPVQQKDLKKKSTSKMSILKRPSSAGNRFFQPNKHDDLSSNLLASTVHISRDKLNVNLGKTIFFKPEVESVKMS